MDSNNKFLNDSNWSNHLYYDASQEPILSSTDNTAIPRCTPSGSIIAAQKLLADVGELLAAKNAAYGDSAMNPLRVFSKSDVVEQIRVRCDDKLSRIARGSAAGEDTIKDLIGYLALLYVAESK